MSLSFALPHSPGLYAVVESPLTTATSRVHPCATTPAPSTRSARATLPVLLSSPPDPERGQRSPETTGHPGTAPLGVAGVYTSGGSDPVRQSRSGLPRLGAAVVRVAGGGAGGGAAGGHRATVYGKRRFGGRVLNPQENVLVTNGASGAIYLALVSLVDEGDEVLLVEPAFDIYLGAVKMAGGTAKHVPLRPRYPQAQSAADLDRGERRGVRASGVRRCTAREHGVAAGHVRAVSVDLLGRQDLQRDRLEDRLGHWRCRTGAAPAQRAAVCGVLGVHADAGGGGRVPGTRRAHRLLRTAGASDAAPTRPAAQGVARRAPAAAGAAGRLLCGGRRRGATRLPPRIPRGHAAAAAGTATQRQCARTGGRRAHPASPRLQPGALDVAAAPRHADTAVGVLRAGDGRRQRHVAAVRVLQTRRDARGGRRAVAAAGGVRLRCEQHSDALSGQLGVRRARQHQHRNVGAGSSGEVQRPPGARITRRLGGVLERPQHRAARQHAPCAHLHHQHRRRAVAGVAATAPRPLQHLSGVSHGGPDGEVAAPC
eukprot:ctg_552.g253